LLEAMLKNKTNEFFDKLYKQLKHHYVKRVEQKQKEIKRIIAKIREKWLLIYKSFIETVLLQQQKIFELTLNENEQKKEEKIYVFYNTTTAPPFLKTKKEDNLCFLN